MNIVLVEPRIPQNTGNIARLTAATNSTLHLIEPLGFDLSDKYLKRAGLDYWEFVDFKVHKSWDAFLSTESPNLNQIWIFSTHGKKEFTEVKYSTSDYLVFGNEVAGLDKSYHSAYSGQMLKIPMDNENVRSFNLANSVAIALFETKKQLR